MDLKELKSHLEADKQTYEFEEAGDGLKVKNKATDVEISCSPEGILQNDWPTIKCILTGGKDVLHITRVTGYWGITEGFNRSKQAELKDRFRATGGLGVV